MSLFKSYSSLLRSSPLVRTASWLFILAAAFAFFSLISIKAKKKPSIEFISPSIGSPGDEMTICGSGFGETRKTSYVEIAGSRITASGYISWSDEKIRIVLPPNVQDGLVTVGTSAGISEPAFFVNEAGIPAAVRELPGTSLPSISSILPERNVQTGQKVTISGSNFGSARGTSKVYFTANREESATFLSEQDSDSQQKFSLYIPASEADFDYVSWSDSEITVRIPDGADSGSVFVETSRGSSSPKKISVEFPAGKKQYANRRTYVVQIAADISNHVSSQESSVLLYIPKPAVSSFQPYVQLNEVYPEPFILDDEHDVIHKRQLNQITNNKQRFSQTFVVSAYSVKDGFRKKGMQAGYSTESPLYIKYVSSDACIPSDAAAVLQLLESIAGKERGPWKKAKLIYDFMTSSYAVSEKVRNGDISALDLIRKKRGDAYDFAILFTALCRAAKIPAVPVAGILVNDKNDVAPHWWTEIYFEGYGWFPVDTALGAGLSFSPFIETGSLQEFYFGNLDNQHIAFSRGWKQIRQSSVNSKIVYRPRTYALQSVWEEAGDATSSYSSLWNNPVIQGIY